MTENLKRIVDDALGELDDSLTQEHVQHISKVIERAVIRGMLEGHHSAVNVCHEAAGEAEAAAAA